MTPRRFTRVLDRSLVVGVFLVVLSVEVIRFLAILGVSIFTGGLFMSIAVSAGRLKVFVRGVDSLERIGGSGALQLGMVDDVLGGLNCLAGEMLDRIFDGVM